MDDLDPISLTQYRNRISARTPQHPWLSEDLTGLLTKLGGWRTDRQTDKSGLTVAGLLMFGRDEAIRDPAALPQYHVDFREKLSDDPEVRWTDRLTVDGTWVANLFQYYQRVIAKLTKDLKIPFQLQPDLFRKDDTIVHEAIREALVNALIHADYRGQGGVVVERYPHRIELSNPGSLLVSIEQMQKGGVSECRNKSIQQMFQQIGGGEKAGSGIDKIRQGWESQKWRWPLIHTQLQPDRVKLLLPMLSLLPDESIAMLQSCLGSDFGKLNGEQVQALVTADVEGCVTNLRLQQFSKSHTADITKMLGELVGHGLLTKDGYGRWASYRLNPGRFPSPEDEDTATAAPGSTSPSNKVSSSNMGSSSPDITASPPDIDPASVSHPDPTTDPELLRIAGPSRDSRRILPARTESIIAQLCYSRFLTYHEIGALLNRVPRDARDRFLSPMVADGRLQLRFPQEPSHPNQAYITVDTSEETI